MRELYEAFLNRVKEEKSVKIFGAGKFAKTLCYLFDKNYIIVDSFVVTDTEVNPHELLHRPVIGLDSLKPQELSGIVVGVEKKRRYEEYNELFAFQTGKKYYYGITKYCK